MALAAGLAGTTAARGADVKFTPSIGVSVYHDGNVAIIDDPSQAGDDAAAIAADLDLERSTAVSSLSFTYRPIYVAYRENDENDYFGNSARMGYTHSYSARTNLTVDVAGSRTQRQGVRPFRPGDPVTFVVRTTETRADARVGGTFGLTRRSVMDWGVSGGLATFDSADLSDSNNYEVNGAWRYALSETSSLGIGARANFYTYDTGVDATGGSVYLTGTHQFGRTVSFRYGAGATRTGSDGTSDTDFTLDATITRDISEVSTLSAGVRQSVGPGSGLGGATLDSGAYVAYRHLAQRKGIEANVLAAFWQRDDVAVAGSGDGATNTWSSAESLGWAFNEHFSLSAIHTYSDQSVGPALSTTLNTSHNSYGLFFRWTISGR